ncbi:uncharacterized protein LOC135842536 isoform X3 [Planococcus citri]|uniref:uncharacterized protein LOC135842536 isoform X3 n=1 Tax=Planococcus citri TaxID=170843 RepID=UPI0031F9C667
MSANQPVEQNNLAEQHEVADFICLYDMPSLQEIALNGVIISMWRCTNSRLESEFQQHAQQLIQNLKGPRSIENSMYKILRKVCQETTDWVGHIRRVFFRCKFLRGRYDIRHVDPKWCVWTMNGEVDYRESARKILETNNLPVSLKFLIMCEYCVEDEIKKFPLHLLPAEFISELKHRHHVCFYWICFLKNELHKMLIGNNHSSADLAMAMNFTENNRFVNEFFWNRLNDDDQVTMAKDWIHLAYQEGRRGDCIILERIISSMSLDQQQRLLSEISDTIVIYFALYSHSSRCALWAWRSSKHQMDMERFTELVSVLMYESRSEQSTFVLNEVWNTASNDKKDHVIQTKLDEFFDEFPYNDQFEFSRTFLHLIPEDERKPLIFKIFDRSAIHQCDPHLLNPLLDACLPRSDDQSTLKKSLIESPKFRKHLQHLFVNQKFEILNEKLKFCFSSDAKAVQIFKREFLKEESTLRVEDIGLITNIERWNESSNFIGETFDEDLISALKAKQRIISMLASSIVVAKNYSNLRSGFDNLTKVVETVFANDELKDLKRSYSDYFRRLVECPFVKSDHETFNSKAMQWCLDTLVDDDEELILSSKKLRVA